MYTHRYLCAHTHASTNDDFQILLLFLHLLASLHNLTFLNPNSQSEAVVVDGLRTLTSFSDELAERSTSWASKNSETDSDMERRLSLATCCDRGRLT